MPEMPQTRPFYDFNSAIVREPSTSVVNGFRADDRGNPTYEGIKAEHDAYMAAMRNAGVEVTVLSPLEAFPDSIFVEDRRSCSPTAPSYSDRGRQAGLTRPRELHRSCAISLKRCSNFRLQGRPRAAILCVRQKGVLIGLSARTDRFGAEALVYCVEKLGGKALIAEMPKGVLHFKTASSLVDDETITATSALADAAVFEVFARSSSRKAKNRQRTCCGSTMSCSPAPITLARSRCSTRKVTRLYYETTEIEKIDAGLVPPNRWLVSPRNIARGFLVAWNKSTFRNKY